MYFTSEEMWKTGEKSKSDYQLVLDFLENNSETFFTENDVATEALDEPTFGPETDLEGTEARVQRELSIAGTTKAKIILERLVFENEVEKREISIKEMTDEIDRQTNFTDNLPDEIVEEANPEELGSRPFYRIA